MAILLSELEQFANPGQRKGPSALEPLLDRRTKKLIDVARVVHTWSEHGSETCPFWAGLGSGLDLDSVLRKVRECKSPSHRKRLFADHGLLIGDHRGKVLSGPVMKQFIAPVNRLPIYIYAGMGTTTLGGYTECNKDDKPILIAIDINSILGNVRHHLRFTGDFGQVKEEATTMQQAVALGEPKIKSGALIKFIRMKILENLMHEATIQDAFIRILNMYGAYALAHEMAHVLHVVLKHYNQDRVIEETHAYLASVVYGNQWLAFGDVLLTRLTALPEEEHAVACTKIVDSMLDKMFLARDTREVTDPEAIARNAKAILDESFGRSYESVIPVKYITEAARMPLFDIRDMPILDALIQV